MKRYSAAAKGLRRSTNLCIIHILRLEHQNVFNAVRVYATGVVYISFICFNDMSYHLEGSFNLLDLLNAVLKCGLQIPSRMLLLYDIFYQQVLRL